MANSCSEKLGADEVLLRFHVPVAVGFDAKRLFPSMSAIQKATGLNSRSPDPDSRYGLSGEVLVMVPPERQSEIDQIRAVVEKVVPGITFKAVETSSFIVNTKVAQ